MIIKFAYKYRCLLTINFLKIKIKDMKKLKLLMIFAFILMTSSLLNAQNEDKEGCKDHPMFNRMTGFYLQDCALKEFNAYQFTVENSTENDAKKQNIEGKYFELYYQVNEGVQVPSALQVFRNFENAFKQIKATIVAKLTVDGNSYSFITAKVVKGNMETWVCVQATGNDYQLYIIEKETMVQVIQANEILSALNKDGYIALDILFDTGKATIKSESQAIVDEIYSLLNTNANLKVSIEGHTDNVGDAASNKKLSEARAKTIMDVLIAKGIKKESLSSVGWGQEKPVADNRTEEGRAKNRRVEIVKK